MKFDVVVGNPPYQENDNGKRANGTANASASPLYHYFFYLAKEIANDEVSLIFPARWLNGAGKGLRQFSQEMLHDKHIRSLSVFKRSALVFPNTEIKGGVLYFTYTKKHTGTAEISVIDHDNKKYAYTGFLDSTDSGIFIPYGELVAIFQKISSKVDLKKENITQIVSTRKPYGLTTDFFNTPEKFGLPPVYGEKRAPDDLEILGLLKNKRVVRYVPKNYPVPTGQETIQKWKVFGAYAYGSGEFGEKGPELIVGRPAQISTETFLVFGPFDSKYAANAFKKYFYTKFFRALVGIMKTTQHSTTTYGFVPLQDFTETSDIDWSKSIAEIDRQLYKKYGLEQTEIDFIETKVKSME